MTDASLTVLREGTRRLLSTLLVCVGALALMQAAACPSLDDAGRLLSSSFALSSAANPLALTAGTVAEDPPDNDDDGDDDVIGASALVPDRPSSGAATRARFLTSFEHRPAQRQRDGCRALRAPPHTIAA